MNIFRASGSPKGGRCSVTLCVLVLVGMSCLSISSLACVYRCTAASEKKKGCGFRYDQGTEKHRAKGLVEWKDRLVSYTHMLH